MNIHHLELFYYVAKHGGIAEAVRKMPYGIQQPAISVQIIQLEKSLGTTLFRRRPFELTAPGRVLFQFIESFFSGTEAIAARLRGEAETSIRIGASQIILRDYLPRVLGALRQKVPALRVTLREGFPHDLLQAVDDNELDLVITSIDPRPPAGFRKVLLAKLPLQLLVPARSPLADAEELWSRARIDEPLITLPVGEPACRIFQKELGRRRLEWAPTMEVSSLDLVVAYVREGLGLGLAIATPGVTPQGVRALPLKGFPPWTLAAVWRQVQTPAAKQLVQMLAAQAAALRPM
jgi:DNA-binding transcriptional LysR family regulator